ncbi:MAG: hypothetical protein ACM3PY_03365 [Omnitrophica WOR_2 bacterium]
MESKVSLNHKYASIAWGALFIWWGIAVTLDPITLGMTAIGTGLILLTLNAARARIGIHPDSERSNAILGVMAITWGILDQARLMLALPLGLSFALMLFVIGLVILCTPLLKHPGAV